MKIALAQTKPAKGNVQYNIKKHKKIIALALSYTADIILFPELSITGYEPELAKELATTADDIRFDGFQNISNTNNITICIGVPLKAPAGTTISMIIFQPGRVREVYSKRYLHVDEEPYFINGEHPTYLKNYEHTIAPAICYELSVPEHAEQAYSNDADIYLVSVAKSIAGMEKAAQILSSTAAKYSMTVILSNCVGYCDNFLSAGQSAVWNSKGELRGQLNDADEGLLIFDTATEEVIEKYIVEKQTFN